MNRLKELQSGQLTGTTRLKLACNLTKFPKEIFSLSETLEILDMTDNRLSTLPDDFGKLKKLKILFLSNNLFEALPTVLADCPHLTMIGFRNNRIKTIAENALPATTRWLILTDNALERLPNSIGELKALQKCMLSGNHLTTLPDTLAQCHNLELLRISANKFTQLPQIVLELPKLSWLAFGANPFCTPKPSLDIPLRELHWEDLEVKELLGEGASGLIYRAIFEGKEVALKVFKGEITSDGLPLEEIEINMIAKEHPRLINLLARVTNHPRNHDVVMLELIPGGFKNLGLPPSFESCSRDLYPDEMKLTLPQALNILKAIASAAAHLHGRAIMHGDLYAHNIMIDARFNALLGDFGAASYYGGEKKEIRNALQRLEVRAFGYLIEELLQLAHTDNKSQELIRTSLSSLKKRCLTLENQNRPLFSDIKEILSLL